MTHVKGRFTWELTRVYGVREVWGGSSVIKNGYSDLEEYMDKSDARDALAIFLENEDGRTEWDSALSIVVIDSLSGKRRQLPWVMRPLGDEGWDYNPYGAD